MHMCVTPHTSLPTYDNVIDMYKQHICCDTEIEDTCKPDYAMVVCRSHDTAGSLANGVFMSRPTGKIQTHWQNPDPLVKSRPTGWDIK